MIGFTGMKVGGVAAKAARGGETRNSANAAIIGVARK